MIAAAWLALLIYNFFEGETLLRDLIDEVRLSRTSLTALDKTWARNPEKSDVIVSLSTIPSRLPHIAPTLKSLLRQSRAPKRIVLNLPAYSLREKTDYMVPDFLKALSAVEVIRCDDLGPATKLTPTLLRETPSQAIIVVDDDRIYPPTLVAELEDAAAAAPDTAFAMCGWIVPPDLIDRPTTVWSNLMLKAPVPLRARRLRKPVAIDILMEFAGYIVRPRFFDVAAIQNYAASPPEAFYVDDVWFSAHCRAAKVVLPARRYNYQPKLRRAFYERTSLAVINRGPGGDERRNNTLIIKKFADKWRVGGKR
ncbi:hypothetical protein [Aestuariivirga sp.]|uniref:hypothetical protein n=1 Tax=Aestuariivirga sp. TaxID=2650926 RepID=UPI0039E43C77